MKAKQVNTDARAEYQKIIEYLFRSVDAKTLTSSINDGHISNLHIKGDEVLMTGKDISCMAFINCSLLNFINAIDREYQKEKRSFYMKAKQVNTDARAEYQKIIEDLFRSVDAETLTSSINDGHISNLHIKGDEVLMTGKDISCMAFINCSLLNFINAIDKEYQKEKINIKKLACAEC